MVRRLTLAAALALVTTPLAAEPNAWLPAVSTAPGARHLEIDVTNGDVTARRFILDQVPTGAPTAHTRDLGLYWVGAGDHRVERLTLDPVGGLVGVDLRPHMSVSARVIGQQGARTEVPVITRDGAVGAGQSVVLRGVTRRGPDLVTGLGIVNVAGGDARCTVRVRDVVGAGIGPQAEVRPPAGSQAWFPDIGGILGRTHLEEATVTVSCNRPFVPYLFVSDRAGATGRFVGGSAEPAPPGEPAANGPSVVFNRQGTFHVPTRARPTAAFDIAVGRTRYQRAVLDIDITHGGWYAREPEKNHSLFWIHRGKWLQSKWKRNIFGFLNAFGPGSNRVKLMWDVDLKNDRKEKALAGARLQPGRTYHVRWEYDTGRGRVTTRITDNANGQVVTALSGRTTGPIVADGSGHFMVYFGHENGSAKGYGPEVPTYGWKYSNLRVEFVP